MNLCYWSRLFGNLLIDDNYKNLKRTITINILGFNLFKGNHYRHRGFIFDPK